MARTTETTSTIDDLYTPDEAAIRYELESLALDIAALDDVDDLPEPDGQEPW